MNKNQRIANRLNYEIALMKGALNDISEEDKKIFLAVIPQLEGMRDGNEVCYPKTKMYQERPTIKSEKHG